MTPDHLRYTKEHEWALQTEVGNVRFGITHHAQDALGDVVFVTLPDVGTALSVGDSCGEIESTKSVSEIFAPISGEVVARNDSVETSPETINSDPYGSGWLVEIAPGDSEQFDTLLSAAAYDTLIS